ncbi:response regulator transcription factor, partial [Kitasatospora sp. NPDC057500]|uniref:response regulator transcription factor n=1 Tax=Kitasatospora sp. NPDC057500 TaxID=3346151 RepID=UPI0036BF7A05
MTKPPTAAHPGNQPAPATQRRSGKGRPGRTGNGRGRADGPPAAPATGDGGGAALLRRLTEREAQAFAHLAAGRDLAETAAALGVTPTTARSYQHRALRKLGTRTQAEITALAALLPVDQAPPDGAGTPQPTTTTATEPADGRHSDHMDTPASPSRQEEARRPVGGAIARNRPQGVRAGRTGDVGAQAPPSAGRTADALTSPIAAHAGNPAAVQAAGSDAERESVGLDDRSAAKQPTTSEAARTPGPDNRRAAERKTEPAAPDSQKAPIGRATALADGGKT